MAAQQKHQDLISNESVPGKYGNAATAVKRHPVIRAAGFNGHSQLRAEKDVDLSQFEDITVGLEQTDGLDILFAGWSTTVFTNSKGEIWSLGHQILRQLDQEHTGHEAKPQIIPECAFGDHNGLLGFVYSNGALALISQEQPREKELRAQSFTVRLSEPDSPPLGFVAVAGNDRVAVTFRQAPNARLCHVEEFETLGKFVDWYGEPANQKHRPIAHHMIPGRPKQLIASTAGFLKLMESGEVYSWGDPRYQSLGRAITGDGATPADRPGIIEAVGGLKIDKIATGGWMSAALSKDRALYLWGASKLPGSEHAIKCLSQADPGEPLLVIIPDDKGQPLDILDVGIGVGHIAVLAADSDSRQIYVCGNNGNGQLGIGSEEQFLDDWTKVDGSGDVQRVLCGPNSTYCFAVR